MPERAPEMASCPAGTSLQDAGDCSDLAFVEWAYARVLGRAVDPQGLLDHLTQLHQGVPRSQLLQALHSSDEAQRRLGQRGPGPSAAPGLGLGAQALADASEWPLARLLDAPVDSFVHLAYLRMLGRPPDADGHAAYTAQLRAGTSRLHILQRLQDSAEAQARRRSGRPGLQLPAVAAPSHTRLLLRQAKRWLLALRGPPPPDG